MPDGMIQLDLDQTTLEATKIALRGIPNGVAKATAMAENETAKKLTTFISSGIRAKFPIKKSELDPNINTKRANPADQSPEATVTLSKTKRMVLGFGARQSSGGVSYSVGAQFIPHAFGPDISYRLGNHVWLRTGVFSVPEQGRYEGRVTTRAGKRSGSAGSPLVREQLTGPKRGPSPWGVFLKSGMMQPSIEFARDEMQVQLKRAAKYFLFKNGMLAA